MYIRGIYVQYLGNGIVKSGIVNNSGLGDGRLCCHRVVYDVFLLLGSRYGFI